MENEPKRRGRPRKIAAVDPVVASIAAREGVSTATVMRRLDDIAAGQAQQARLMRPAKDARTPRPGDEYAALRPFGYCGVDLDRGQIFQMRGAVNDERLHRLGYCAPFDRDDEERPLPCRVCSAEFVTEAARDAHGTRRHQETAAAPLRPPTRERNESEDMYQNRLDDWALAAGRQADADLEHDVNRDDALAPLRLDRSAATRG